MLVTTFVSKRDMKWAKLRQEYACSKAKIKTIEALKRDGRIFYAINGNWSNTNLISVYRDHHYLYMWGSELSCGWVFQPVKIPLSDMQYLETRLCFFKRREVYGMSISNTEMQYAVPKEHIIG